MSAEAKACANVLGRIEAVCGSVSPQAVDELLQNLEAVEFRKGESIVAFGQLCGYAYFIEKGITRSFWIVDGEEITTSFSTEGCIVFSMDEVYYGRRSEEFVEALEPIVAYRISLTKLRDLIRNNLEWAVWWSKIHENEYRRIHQSHKERLSLPAAERYRMFYRQFPDVCRRVKRSYVASYLGISLSTLSRIGRI